MKYLYFIFLVCFSLSLSAQTFFLNDSNGDLVQFNASGCTTSIIQSIGSYTDIASHPDGNFYGVNSSGQIYRINVAMGTSTLLLTIPSGGEFFTALTADTNGEIFAATLEGTLFSYNPVTGNIVDYGPMGFGSSGDLTFYQGEMYMASSGNQLVKINPNDASQNTVFIDFSSTNATIFGIVSFVNTCDIQTYAFSNDSNAKVYEIDWDNASFNYVCDVPKRVYGGASEFEFDASESAIAIGDIIITQRNCSPALFDVEIEATSQNGVLEYSFDDVIFQEESLFEYVEPGSYTLFVQDNLGCEYQEDFTVMDGQVISMDTVFVNPVSCDGAELGSISIEASSPNGDLLYSFEGNTPSTSNTFTDLDLGTYSVEVTDPQGCSEDLSIEIVQQAPAVVPGTYIFGAMDTSCGEDNGSIYLESVEFVSGYTGGLSWTIDGVSWISGMGTISEVAAGDYVITVRDDFGCIEQLPVRVRESGLAQVYDIRGENVTCVGNDGIVGVDAYSSVEITYTILGGESNNTGIFEGLLPGTYQVQVSTEDCALEPVEVSLEEDCRIYIPNAFSPNQDGFNDTFNVYGSSDFEVTEILVFNRWGGIVYNGNNVSTRAFSGNGWDGTINGKPAPSGIYTYIITAQNPNGTRQFSGDITLIR